MQINICYMKNNYEDFLGPKDEQTLGQNWLNHMY